MNTTQRIPLALCLGTVLAWPLAGRAADSTSQCSTQSNVQVPVVVELYTSEGCSSCPPADRWLSTLKGRGDVLALSFHVDYWDRLGWKDRFADPAHTQRQAQLLRTSGARYAYTPQVVVDGRDQPRWSKLPLTTARAPATLQATLRRDGTGYRAYLSPLPGASARIAGFWAVTEDGHASAVKSGENRGTRLTHDFVVREYLPIAPLTNAGGSAMQLQFSPVRPADVAHPRRVNLVLVDADNGSVLQALALDC
jgi:hypothetical protein